MRCDPFLCSLFLLLVLGLPVVGLPVRLLLAPLVFSTLLYPWLLLLLLLFPSLLLLVQNTAVLGAMLWLYHGQGLLLDFVGWLSIRNRPMSTSAL